MNKEFIDYITLAASLLAAGGTVYAAQKSAVAANAASKSADISKKQFEDQTTERKKIERPILTPLSKEFVVEIDTVFRDWNASDRRLSIQDQYSAFDFEVFNTGKSFALDVQFSFTLSDDRTSIPELNYDLIKLEKRENAFEDTSNHDKIYIDVSEGEDPSHSLLIEPFEQFFSLIESNQSCKVNIHFYFILLNNIYLKFNDLIDDFSNNIPKLFLTINYKDQHKEVYQSNYVMQLCHKNKSSYDSLFHGGRMLFELISTN